MIRISLGDLKVCYASWRFFISNEESLKCLIGIHERKGFPFWLKVLCLKSMAHTLSSVTFNRRKRSMPVHAKWWSTFCSSSQNGIGYSETLTPFASQNKCIAQQFICNCNGFKYLYVYIFKKLVEVRQGMY